MHMHDGDFCYRQNINYERTDICGFLPIAAMCFLKWIRYCIAVCFVIKSEYRKNRHSESTFAELIFRSEGNRQSICISRKGNIMEIDLNNFEKSYTGIYDLYIKPAIFDVGGGHFSETEVDIIKDYPNARSVCITGCDQRVFEYFIRSYGKQFEAISFFKNKTINDLSLLGTLSGLKYLHFFFNQKVTSLWDMSNNINLTAISLDGFSKLKSLKNIETAPCLKYFDISSGGWGSGIKGLESLKPVVNSTIEHLGVGVVVEDGDYMCLADSKVTTLDVVFGRFTMDELARMAAMKPDMKGSVSSPYTFGSVTEKGTTTEYIYLCKGKRRLVKGKDDEKFARYLSEFNSLVKKYKESS